VRRRRAWRGSGERPFLLDNVWDLQVRHSQSAGSTAASAECLFVTADQGTEGSAATDRTKGLTGP